MPLTTYDELKTSIAGFLHRADLTSAIPDFITLCEVKFNRNLRISTMETRATADLDQQYEAVPLDFLEMRYIQTTGALGSQLEYVSPASFNHRYKTTDVGTPKLYTIIDGTIGFAPAPSGTYTMEMGYFKAIPSLSASQTSNWMLANHPDVYLYGSLKEAEPYIKNDKRIAVWESKYGQAIQEVKEADQRARWAGPLTIRAQNL